MTAHQRQQTDAEFTANRRLLALEVAAGIVRPQGETGAVDPA